MGELEEFLAVEVVAERWHGDVSLPLSYLQR